MRVPWAAGRSNQSILKEISPEYSLEGLPLKLKLQYFGHLMQRTDSLEKALMLRKTEGKRRREWQRMRWLDSISTSSEYSGLISLRIDWSDWTARDSQESSPAPQFESISSSTLSLLMVQLSHLYMITGNTIALTIREIGRAHV